MHDLLEEIDISAEADTEPEPPPPRAASSRTGPARRLLAFAADALLLSSVFAALASVALLGQPYPLDFALSQARVFAALLALLAVAYSWFFIALGARTPGMALARLRLQTLQGAPPAFFAALVRAVLALPSAALGLFGFLLALFDARGQTLHDKLCRCIAVID